MAVPLPSLDSNKEAPRTKGEQMKIILGNMKQHYDQIRRHIFDQCPRSIPPSTLTELRTQAFEAQRNSKGLATVNKSILDLLRTTHSGPDGGAQFALSPIRPNHTDSRPVPQTQSLEMQPFLNELAPIIKALDTFNWHALKELKEAEQRYDDLESSGRARHPLVNVTAHKRSAHHANLDDTHGRPPAKRSATSSTKVVERLVLNRSVSFTPTRGEVLSQTRREEGTKLVQSSPLLQVSKLPADRPDRTKSPIPAIRDSGHGNTDARSNLNGPMGSQTTRRKI